MAPDTSSASAIAKTVAPVTVSVFALLGIPLQEWVYIVTIIFVCVQLLKLTIEWVRAEHQRYITRREAKDQAKAIATATELKRLFELDNLEVIKGAEPSIELNSADPKDDHQPR